VVSAEVKQVERADNGERNAIESNTGVISDLLHKKTANHKSI
jgi:hypothetical protein